MVSGFFDVRTIVGVAGFGVLGLVGVSFRVGGSVIATRGRGRGAGGGTGRGPNA